MTATTSKRYCGTCKENGVRSAVNQYGCCPKACPVCQQHGSIVAARCLFCDTYPIVHNSKRGYVVAK